MGIPAGISRVLIEEAKARPFAGSVLQLGRSTVYFTEDDLRRWSREQGYVLAEPEAEEGESLLSHDPRLAAQGCLSDRRFFRLLGLDHVESCDISDWEGAEHIVDLNRPVTEELEGRFGVSGLEEKAGRGNASPEDAR